MRNVAFAVLRLILLSAMVGGWFVSTPAKGYACSCSGIPPSDLAEFTAVFTATVTGIDHHGGTLRVTFQVDNVWKGPVQETLIANTSSLGAACGYEFEEGMDYIVYAHGDESDLWVSLCSPTEPLSQVSTLPEMLGQASTSHIEALLDTVSTPHTTAYPGKDSNPQSIGCNAPFQSDSKVIDLSMAVIMVGLAGLGFRSRYPMPGLP